MLDFYYSSDKLFFPLLLLLVLTTGLGFGTVYIVSESGVDYTIIQDALNVAVAGDTILVRETELKDLDFNLLNLNGSLISMIDIPIWKKKKKVII